MALYRVSFRMEVQGDIVITADTEESAEDQVVNGDLPRLLTYAHDVDVVVDGLRKMSARNIVMQEISD